jgi:ureidoglycolate lyase
MRAVPADRITHEAIAPYGAMADFLEPQGFSLDGELHRFFPDRVMVYSEDDFAFSPLTVKKPEKMIVDAMEMHELADEIILPLDDDVVVHVAPTTPGKPDTTKAEAFVVPKGTLVKLNRGVWHLAPLPVNLPAVHVMIGLPQRTYALDCEVVPLPEGERFEIIL